MIKNRAFLIILAGGVFFFILLNYFFQSDAVGQTASAQVSAAPNISAVPGEKTNNKRYIELQEENNKQRAETAKQNLDSYVPTLVNKSDDENTAMLDKLLEEKRRKQDEAEEARNRALKEAQALSEKRLKEQQDRMDKMRKEQEDRRKASEMARLADQKAKDRLKALNEKKKNYLNKINALHDTIKYKPTQSYVAGSNASSQATGNLSGSSSSQPSLGQAPLYKAGTILYAVLETALNTDEPAPILAKITSGPLKGSRLVGSSKALGSEWAQGVVLEFSTISIPMMPTSQTIRCIAVDPVSARTALADEVNNHYIQRYGALFFSKLLEGYAGAIQSSGSVTEKDADGNKTITNKETTDAEKFMIALGNVGTALGAQVGTYVNRPVTIKMNQGSPMGLLILDDFSIQS